MFSSTTLFTILTLLASHQTLAQSSGSSSVPDISSIPSACGSSCGSLIETVTLCAQQYPFLSSGANASMQLELAACVCTGLPTSSDLQGCSTCLEGNNDQPAGQAVMTLSETCQAADQACAFECNFPTCSSSDIPCQCSETYLQNILTCASCNSANNNVGSTMLADYNALKDSCVNQNYTETPTGTQGLPSPTGQANYQSPTLTGTGQAAAAASGGAADSTASASAAAGGSTVTTSAAAGNGRGASSVVAAASSSSDSGSAPIPTSSTSSSSSSSSGAIVGTKPALAIGGVIALLSAAAVATVF